MPVIRPSTEDDLQQITSIYAHHVHHGTGTFEITAPTVLEMTDRRQDVLNKGLPYLVLAHGSQVLGFAYCNWFKPRPAYRYSAEDSIYLAADAAQKGWGTCLLAELCTQAERQGVRSLIAVIGDSDNIASIKVHRRVGFESVGTLKSCGWKFDRWLDVVLLSKTLGAGASQAPSASINRGA